jgi:hypothetical protein
MSSIRWRRVVSLALLWLAIVLTYTGVVLFIAPQGRIAYWTDWHLLGLDKHQLGAIHTISAFSFVILGVLHTWYNWKPIVNYLKDRAQRLRVATPEMILATLLVLVLVVGSGLSLPPFVQIIDAGEDAKAWWEEREGSPPFGHAELASLDKIAKRLGLEPALAVEILQDEGFVVESASETLEEIAVASDSSPARIYQLMQELSELQ